MISRWSKLVSLGLARRSFRGTWYAPGAKYPEIKMKSYKEPILAIAILLSMSSTVVMGQNKIAPSSGIYAELMVGIDQRSGVITGYYENGTGWDDETKSSRFTCSFYLYGVKQADSFKIVTWWPGNDPAASIINGRLDFKPDGSIDVLLEREHGGCWNVQHFADKDQPTNLTLDKRGSWTSIRVVKVRRAYLYDKPNQHTPRKAYLTKHDVIRVFSNKSGWVEAEYGVDKISKGWIKESDLYDFKPRKTR